MKLSLSHTHTHILNGPFSGTNRVRREQKSETNLDFTEARDSDRQWHQLDHMQSYASLHTTRVDDLPGRRTPFYQCQPPRGTTRQTVNSRQPSLCGCGSTHLKYTAN